MGAGDGGTGPQWGHPDLSLHFGGIFLFWPGGAKFHWDCVERLLYVPYCFSTVHTDDAFTCNEKSTF